MKYYVLFSVLNFCLAAGLLAQSPAKKQNLPKENSKVTREYDEKGNLIRFDSVYSYSYSSDSTLMKDFSPKDFSGFFGPGFGFSNDSTFKGNSFFDEFDRFFAQPFDGKRDSVLMNQFKNFHRFNDFQFPGDSLVFNFNFPDDFWGGNNIEKNDSTQSKPQFHSFKNQPKSMEEMMQMFRQEIQEMEKQHRQFFEKNQKLKEF